jgi:hypothetical protein
MQTAMPSTVEISDIGKCSSISRKCSSRSIETHASASPLTTFGSIANGHRSKLKYPSVVYATTTEIPSFDTTWEYNENVTNATMTGVVNNKAAFNPFNNKERATKDNSLRRRSTK